MARSTQKYLAIIAISAVLSSCGRPSANIGNMKFASNNEQVVVNQQLNNKIQTATLDSFVVVPQIAVAQNQPAAQPTGAFYLPVNEQFQYIREGGNSDMAFEFYLPENLSENDSIVLTYQLNGVQDFTSLIKKINNSDVVGGKFLKTDTTWYAQTEELPYFALQKGKNIIRYQLPDGVHNLVGIKDMQLQVIPKIKNDNGYIVVNQPNNRAFYRAFGYLQGFVNDDAVLKIDNKEVKTKNGFFECIVSRDKKAIAGQARNDSEGDVWTSKIEVEYPNGTKVEREVTFSNSIDYDFETGLNYVAKSTKQDITPENEFELSLLGAKFFGNKNSVLENKTLSITALRSIDMAVVSSDIFNVTAESAGYRFLPDGQKFENQQVIALKYDTALIEKGYTPNDIFTFYYDENLQNWQRIERDSIDLANCVIYSHTDHFTDYINGILKAPELPDVQAYTPTMIKDLQAAHPHTGIGQFSVPEANNKGTANTSMPLWLPAGRNGMQPNLSLTYNSGGGNGWLGQGWDIPFSSIEVETRWGVPLYSSTEETETYLLDGETLVLGDKDEHNKFILKKPTYRRNFEPKINDSVRFYRRVEGAFQKIMRYGNSPKTYYFVVTNKDGSKLTYNEKLKDGSGNAGKWFLTKMEDLNGNFVEFIYQTVPYQQGKQIYIKEINYTGHSDAPAKYKINFELATNSNGSDFIRPDVSSNARKGLLEVNAHLLDRIDVLYEDEILRQYYFGYKTGAYGKTLLCNVLDMDSLFRVQNHQFDSVALINGRCGWKGTQHLINYNFDYYENGTMKFREEQQINVNNNISLDVLPKPLRKIPVLPNMSTIGGTTAWGIGVGISANLGLGPLSFLRTLSLGGHYNYNGNVNSGFVTMLDVNGDGYPDKIRQGAGKKLYYNLQKPNEEDGNSGTFSTDIGEISNANDFNETRNESHSYGFNIFLKFGGDNAGIGGEFQMDWNQSTSNTKIFFADVDGDGLPDIVDNTKHGGIRYNRLNTSNNFTDGSYQSTIVTGSCSNDTIWNDVAVNDSVFMERIDTVLCGKLYEWEAWGGCPKCNKYCSDSIASCHYTHAQNYFCDTITKWITHYSVYYPDVHAVRCWIAPFDGTINIESTVSLTDTIFGDSITGRNLAQERQMYGIKDGVNASIQHKTPQNNPPNNQYSDSILNKVITPDINEEEMNVENLPVVRGEKIYFKLSSRAQRLLDVVNWNPVIYYTNKDTTLRDANGLPYYKFNAGEDFLVNDTIIKPRIEFPQNPTKLPIKGVMNAEINITAPPLTEPLTLTLYYNGYKYVVKYINPNNNIAPANYTTENTEWIFPQGNAINQNILIENIFADTTTQVYAVLSSPGSVDWSKIKANIRLYYTKSKDPDITSVCDSISEPFRYLYDFNLNIYKRVPQTTFQVPQSFVCQTNKILQVTLLPFSRMTIKNAATGMLCFEKENTSFINSILVSPTNTQCNMLPNNSYIIDIYALSDDNVISITLINNLVSYGGTAIQAGIHGYWEKKYRKLGSIYRNWTQFGYKPNEKKTAKYELINETLLKPRYDENTETDLQNIGLDSDNPEFEIDLGSVEHEEEVEVGVSGGNPISGNLFVLSPDFAKNRYSSYGDLVYFAKDTMSNAPQYESEEMIETERSAPVAVTTTVTQKATTVSKKMYSKSRTISGGISAGVKIKEGGDSELGISVSSNKTKGTSYVESDYMDINGDRYPDIISQYGAIYTKPQGRLSSAPIMFNNDNYFINTTESEAKTNSWSAGVSSIEIKKQTTNSPKFSEISVSCGNSNATASDFTKATWLDVNGDGLPDKVDKNTGKVFINLGYKMLPVNDVFNFNHNTIRENFSTTNTQSLGGGADGLFKKFDIKRSISGGLGRSISSNTTEQVCMDINSDGLPDIVYKSGNQAYVKYNTGNGFSDIVPLNVNFDISNSTSANYSINGAFTIGFTFFAILKVTATLGISANGNISAEDAQFTDFNNDGFPDIVKVTSPGVIGVRYAIPHPNNLLKSVETPTNLKMEIEYSMSKQSTVKNPSRNWEMTKCTQTDIANYATKRKRVASFEYFDKEYDRFEREDYGYKKVKTTNYNGAVNQNPTTFISNLTNEANLMPQIITEKYFKNSDNFFKNILDSVVVKDASTSGNRFTKQEIVTVPKEIETGTAINLEQAYCFGAGYPATAEEKTYFYDSQNVARIVTKKQYTHGKYGNVKAYKNFGNILDSSTSDEVTASIQFNEILPEYIVGIPSSITYNNNYTRTGSIDGNGNVTEIRQNGDSGFDRVLNYERDPYGNVTKITYPENAGSERKFVEIAYDSELHALPVKVNDILGYFSKTDYDPRYQVPLQTTDIGGSVMRYSYDNRGRVKEIQSPKDNTATIKYEYCNYMSGYPQWVTTSHYTGGNYIKVKTYSDAFGNIIELDKTIDLGGSNEYSATGIKIYDNLGNVLAEVTEPYIYYSTDFNTMQFANVVNGNLPYRKYKYDKWCRNTKITEPNNIEFITTDYGFGTANNVGCFTTSVTDAASQTSTVWKDVRGLQIQMQSPLGATTAFEYDALGQLKKTIDPETHETLFGYDILGRTLSIDHPSRGLTTWIYDGATSNVLAETNAKGEVTSYKYDILGRPTSKHFSVNYQNDVLYKYGDHTAGLNAGKLTKLQDATGVTEFEYGNMGEVTAQNRMHILPNGSWLTHRTEWIYDSWGRTRSILYPDGENVEYFYNNAGMLKRIKSNTNGVYIDNISYNENEQKESVFYGNGTLAEYYYDPIMKRLTSYDLLDNRGILLMHKNYHYNDIGNIDVLQSNYTAANINISENYVYDEDNRLINASGNNGNIYNLAMEYSPAGKIMYKNLQGTGQNNGGSFSINFSNKYEYNQTNNPYAVSDLIGTDNDALIWDRTGNLCFRDNHLQYFYWTEDNRMQSYYNRKLNTTAYYRYDASGERELKLVSEVIDVDVSGRRFRMPLYDRATLYASNLMTIDYNARTGVSNYTKHYFADTERLLANVAGGGQANISPEEEISSISGENAIKLSKEFTNFASEYLLNVNDAACKKNDIELPANFDRIPNLGTEFNHLLNAHGRDKLYFFNANHLGSGSLITDGSGNTYQTLAFAPFGESLINITHSSGNYDEPYKFTGYEQDQESGLDYAHARSYDPPISIFISTDPLWFDYPDIHSYHYCHNNPIMRTDETGMGDDIYVYKNKEGETVTKNINTGDKTPNRLFVQDENATADTKNRKSFDGMYFEQKMIPMSAYSEEDFENNHPLSILGMGSSQFEKDRTDYVGYAGKYSDTNIWERTVESKKEEGLISSGIEIVSTIFVKGNGGKIGKSINNAFKLGKGERNWTSKPDGTNNPFKKMKPHPTNNKQVIMKDANGKTIIKPKPSGFDEYWQTKK